MDVTNVIIDFRRYLKRRNYSRCTVKGYLSTLKQFVLWLDVPIEAVTHQKVVQFIDHLLDQRLSPKTINCYLDSIRSFYHYLRQQEELQITNPVRRGDALRLPKPLPRFLKDEQTETLFKAIKDLRDRAIFFLMLRCGLRVDEVAHLSLDALDLRRGRMVVENGKGGKGRVVYLSSDAHAALTAYLKLRPSSRVKAVFLVQKGAHKGSAISVRGIQKKMELYAQKSGLRVCCHQLRHTMATQLLNADADLVVIQDLLGHSRITTTQRYCRVSNQKVQQEYYRAMEKVVERTSPSVGPNYLAREAMVN